MPSQREFRDESGLLFSGPAATATTGDAAEFDPWVAGSAFGGAAAGGHTRLASNGVMSGDCAAAGFAFECGSGGGKRDGDQCRLRKEKNGFHGRSFFPKAFGSPPT